MSKNDRKVPRIDGAAGEYIKKLDAGFNAPEHAAAVDKLFDMTGEELGACHAPGRTESQAERWRSDTKCHPTPAR